MIDRRTFISTLGGGLFIATLFAHAQAPGKIYRIGFLISESLAGQASRVEALRAGLRDRGYVEGKNIVVELRSADGNYDRLPELAAELVRGRMEVIVAFGSKAVLAAKGATTRVPIVVPAIGDPVTLGLSGSLSRPSGNVTGQTSFGTEVAAKRLELLKEASPRSTTIAVLLNPVSVSGRVYLESMQAAAKALKVELQPFEVPTPRAFEAVFSAMAAKRVDAIVVTTDTLFQSNASKIAALAATRRLPSVGSKEFAEAGGLVGYGGNDGEMYRHAAYYVDRLLKGAKPADLPIEGITKFELVINAKTAKALGLAIPQALLLRADEVIQ